MKKRGIFCLEGLWDNDLRSKTSVLPMLDLLNKIDNIPYIHKDCGTEAEFEFYLRKFTQRKYAEYKILYLAFHGEENMICIGTTGYTLDQMREILENKCEHKIILIGSCSTLAIDKRHLNRFLKFTGALAVCGYKVDVEWLRASAFEMLILDILQKNEFSGRGVKAIERNCNEMAKLFPNLEFRMVTKRHAERAHIIR